VEWRSQQNVEEIGYVYCVSSLQYKLLTDSILENNKNYDIILIQELPWSNIWQIPSILSQEGNNLIGAPYHPSWTLFVRNSDTENDYPRVAIYVNFPCEKISSTIKISTSYHFSIMALCIFS